MNVEKSGRWGGKQNQGGKTRGKREKEREKKTNDRRGKNNSKNGRRNLKVFKKKDSERMLTRKTWDHAIDLREGFVLKKGKIYLFVMIQDSRVKSRSNSCIE